MLVRSYSNRFDADLCGHCGERIDGWAVALDLRGQIVHAHALCALFPAARVLEMPDATPHQRELAIAALEVYVGAARMQPSEVVIEASGAARG